MCVTLCPKEYVQGDAGDFHGRHPTKTPWISCDMSPADDVTPFFPALCIASMVVLTIDPKTLGFCS